MLRKSFPKKRVFLKPVELARLLEPGKELGRVTCHLSTSSADDESAASLLALADVQCDERLGGLLKHYCRAAQPLTL